MSADRSAIAKDQANMRTQERDLHHDYAEQRAGTNEHAAIDQARAAISTDRAQIGQDRSAMHKTLPASALISVMSLRIGHRWRRTTPLSTRM